MLQHVFSVARRSFATMVYNCLHGKSPSYVTDCCTPISDVASWHYLCSASRRQVLVPRHNLSTYGRRAFSVAGPAAWNCLCDELREPLFTANSFRQLLKTHLFVCLLSTSAYSALEVLHIMRYINLLTYFTYLLKVLGPSSCLLFCCRQQFSFSTGVGKVRPVGQMWPASSVNPARSSLSVVTL